MLVLPFAAWGCGSWSTQRAPRASSVHTRLREAVLGTAPRPSRLASHLASAETGANMGPSAPPARPWPPRHRWAHPNMWHLLRVQRAAMAAPWSWAQGLMCAPPLQRHRSWQPSCLQPNSAEPCGAEDHPGPSTESTPGQRPSCRDAAAGSQIISAVGIQHPPPCSGSALPPHHLPLLFLAWQGSGTLAAL